MSFTGIFKAKDGIVAVVDSKASRVENGQSFEDIQRNPEKLFIFQNGIATTFGANQVLVQNPFEFSSKVIAIEDVKDGIFSEKVLGDGVGIIPTSETVLAPAEGEICTVMEGSKHAIGVRTTNNSVFLIHVGIETVSMNGEGFEYLVKKGQHVKEGQPILKFDRAKIEAKGLNPVVVFVKTEEGNQTPVVFKTGINVKAGKDVIGE